MEILRQHVEALLSPALATLGINNDHWKSMITVSREKNMGDLSLPCFAFAKQLSMAPNEIAENHKHTSISTSLQGRTRKRQYLQGFLKSVAKM